LYWLLQYPKNRGKIKLIQIKHCILFTDGITITQNDQLAVGLQFHIRGAGGVIIN